MTLTWESALAFTALIIQAVALVIWITQRSKVEAWIWWTVTTGFAIMAFHRVNEVWPLGYVSHFDHVTAVLIALVALVSVFQTTRYLRRRSERDAALAVVHSKLEALAQQVCSREPIATKIAEIISDLRAQISYYEEQAKDKGLPLFHK